MFIRKYWLSVSVVLIAIVATGLYLLQTQHPPEPIVIYKAIDPMPTSQRKTDTVSVGSDTVPPATGPFIQTQALPIEVEAPGDVSATVFDTTAERPIVDTEDIFETNMEAFPDESSKAPADKSEAPTNEQTIKFINSHFERAVDLLDERSRIRKRRKYLRLSNGRTGFTQSPEDKARLDEIKYERYEILRRIGEKVPGAIEVKLFQHPSGRLGLTQYYSPDVFQRELGTVPTGFQKYEAVLGSSLKNQVNLPKQ